MLEKMIINRLDELRGELKEIYKERESMANNGQWDKIEHIIMKVTMIKHTIKEFEKLLNL